MRALSYAMFVLGCGLCMVLAARVPAPGSVALQSGSQRLAVWFDAVGPWFIVAFVITAAGALLLRRESASAARQGAAAEDTDVAQMMAQMAETLDGLGEDTATWSHSLGELLDEDIPRLLAQRDRLISERGLGWFAETIGAFARFERNVARAWSALTDGVPEEARACVERARRALAQAQAQL